MAKKHKMNRGVSSTSKRPEKNVKSWPDCIHALDGHGNIFATLPDLGSPYPKFYTIDDLKLADRLASEIVDALPALELELDRLAKA